jgi:integrase
MGDAVELGAEGTMARANRTGVPGLVLITSGPHAGRYRLGFRYTCPVARTPKRLSKLYPRELKTAAIKADARALVNDALTGALARATAATDAVETRVTIASLVADAVGFRAQQGGSPATLLEFRSILAGDEGKSDKAKGGHIVRHLGALAPHDLDSVGLATFVDALKADGLSPLTIRNVFKVLGAFIKIVRVRGLDPALRSNPIREAFELGFALPTKRREAPVILSIADAEKLFGCTDIPEERRVRYVLAFLTGLRDGELAALTWGDVELDTAGAEVLHVTKAFAKIGGLQSTKTTASARTVPLHPQLLPWLRVWRADGWRGLVGRDPKPEDPVLPKAPAVRGPAAKVKPWRPDSARRIQRDLKTASARAPAGIDFHATRRSFASWLEAAGVPHETIERLVGHEPRSVLARHYAATDLGALREAVGRLRLTTGARLRVVA